MKWKKSVVKSRPVIYVGPSFLGLSTNTIFRDGLGKYPAHVSHMIEKNPAIGRLMVPIEEAQQARANVRKQGNILNTFFKQAIKGAKHGL